MLSPTDLFAFADPTTPRLVPPSFPLTPEQSSALEAALRAFDLICREGEDRDAEDDAGASLIDQLAAANARSAALAPAIDDAMAAQDALAAVGLDFSVRIMDGRRHLLVSRCRLMARVVNFEQEAAE
jgi:hypothetical protein